MFRLKQVKSVKIKPGKHTHNGCGIDGELFRDRGQIMSSLHPEQCRLIGRSPTSNKWKLSSAWKSLVWAPWMHISSNFHFVMVQWGEHSVSIEGNFCCSAMLSQPPTIASLHAEIPVNFCHCIFVVSALTSFTIIFPFMSLYAFMMYLLHPRCVRYRVQAAANGFCLSYTRVAPNILYLMKCFGFGSLYAMLC